jgi:predicted lipoprotein with Yx(FWY)xxD motif
MSSLSWTGKVLKLAHARCSRGATFSLVIAASCLSVAGSTASASGTNGTVVALRSTTAYGSVLVVGKGPLVGFPLYEFSGDIKGRFGCGTKRAAGYDLGPIASVPLTCTGPMSDMSKSITSDDWPALTTKSAPVAGEGVKQKLLGSVYRKGIGNQVTYAGHPLYLFDPWSDPFQPQGERYVETVKPLAPWHGIWYLVSSDEGQPAPGIATIENETLPDGHTAAAVQVDPNVGPIALSVYAYSRDSATKSNCDEKCAVEWMPVLTSAMPEAARGINAKDVGMIRRSDGTFQASYDGKPLYFYSKEKVYLHARIHLQSTGSAGNGNGLSGPHGGTFLIIRTP